VHDEIVICDRGDGVSRPNTGGSSHSIGSHFTDEDGADARATRKSCSA